MENETWAYSGADVPTILVEGRYPFRWVPASRIAPPPGQSSEADVSGEIRRSSPDCFAGLYKSQKLQSDVQPRMRSPSGLALVRRHIRASVFRGFGDPAARSRLGVTNQYV